MCIFSKAKLMQKIPDQKNNWAVLCAMTLSLGLAHFDTRLANLWEHYIMIDEKHYHVATKHLTLSQCMKHIQRLIGYTLF